MKTSKDIKKIKTATKGPPKGISNNPAGRPKGIPNKMNATLKEMILGALDKAGGVEYLSRQADENPSAFLTLVGKVLPMTIAGDAANPLAHKVTVEIVRSKISDT